MLRRVLAGIAIALAGLALIGIVAVNAILLPRLDTMLANAMRRELSLPAEATVLIQRGTLKQTLTGFLPRSLIESPSAVLDDIPVEDLHFSTADIDFNMRRILKGEKAQITAVAAAELSLKISIQELKSRLVPLIEKQGPTDVRINFGDDAVEVTAYSKGQLSAKGQFYVIGDNRVGFALTEIVIDRFNITVSNLVLPIDDVIPALDLGGMFAKIVIDELHVTSTYMEITAHTERIAAGQAPGDAVEVF